MTEHLQIKWLTPNELNQLEWAPADIPTVEKLVEKVWELNKMDNLELALQKAFINKETLGDELTPKFIVNNPKNMIIY